MTQRINLRRGLLCAWVVINVPVVLYFGYDSLTMYSCVREIPEHRAFWLNEIRDREMRIDAYRASTERRVPEGNLPSFIGTLEDETRQARIGLSFVVETDRMCRARLLSSGVYLTGVPLGTLAAVFGLLSVI
jgi:hypothetical protein